MCLPQSTVNNGEFQRILHQEKKSSLWDTRDHIAYSTRRREADFPRLVRTFSAEKKQRDPNPVDTVRWTPAPPRQENVGLIDGMVYRAQGVSRQHTGACRRIISENPWARLSTRKPAGCHRAPEQSVSRLYTKLNTSTYFLYMLLSLKKSFRCFCSFPVSTMLIQLFDAVDSLVTQATLLPYPPPPKKKSKIR